MNPICRKKKGMFKGNKVFLEDRNGRKKQAWFVPFAGFFGFWFFITNVIIYILNKRQACIVLQHGFWKM